MERVDALHFIFSGKAMGRARFFFAQNRSRQSRIPLQGFFFGLKFSTILFLLKQNIYLLDFLQLAGPVKDTRARARAHTHTHTTHTHTQTFVCARANMKDVRACVHACVRA